MCSLNVQDPAPTSCLQLLSFSAADAAVTRASPAITAWVMPWPATVLPAAHSPHYNQNPTAANCQSPVLLTI